jgi:hypothetical protein
LLGQFVRMRNKAQYRHNFQLHYFVLFRVADSTQTTYNTLMIVIFPTRFTFHFHAAALDRMKCIPAIDVVVDLGQRQLHNSFYSHSLK